MLAEREHNERKPILLVTFRTHLAQPRHHDHATGRCKLHRQI